VPVLEPASQPVQAPSSVGLPERSPPRAAPPLLAGLGPALAALPHHWRTAGDRAAPRAPDEWNPSCETYLKTANEAGGAVAYSWQAPRVRGRRQRSRRRTYWR